MGSENLVWSESHKRYNPLRKSWVLCSPHRTQRPWQGAQEKASVEKRPQYDDKCYLCPGNSRAGGEQNPKYEETFVFVNDFSAVKPESSLAEARAKLDNAPAEQDELFQAQQATGKCSVICFNPRHDLTLAQMSTKEIRKVVDTWKEVYQKAVDDPEINYCQIFENKGSAMGCSNPHPHGQAWTTNIVPEEPAIEHECLLDYEKRHGKGLLEDYVEKELAIKAKGDEKNDRFIAENDSFIAVIPFWATWPFEIMIVSKRRVNNLLQLDDSESDDFADIIGKVTLRYDNLFETSFPYSMGIHQSFTGGDSKDVEHLHVHFYPPLLRSATVKKFQVGFEMLGMPQRDLTPETAAATLRNVNTEKHYTEWAE